jgi:hypothetical protein
MIYETHGKHVISYVEHDNLEEEIVVSARCLVGSVYIGDAKYALDDTKRKKFVSGFKEIQNKNPWVKRVSSGTLFGDVSYIYRVNMGEYDILCADISEHGSTVQDGYIIESGVVCMIPVDLVETILIDVPAAWFAILPGILTMKMRYNGEIDCINNGRVLVTFNKGGVRNL